MAGIQPIQLPARVQDKTGEHYGCMTVLGFAGHSGKYTAWKCQCVCGRVRVFRQCHLKRFLAYSDCRCRGKSLGHTCSIEGCSKPVQSRGWCNMHYQRWQKYGDVSIAPQRFKGDPVGAFWAKTNKNGPIPNRRPDLGPCWIWTGSINDWGYGMIRPGGGRLAIHAHRFAYTLLVGGIPDGLTIDHLCFTTACVNPAHMEPVTNEVNVLRSNCPPAINARKTHCMRGHEFTPENTYVWKGGRYCRECKRLGYHRRKGE